MHCIIMWVLSYNEENQVGKDMVRHSLTSYVPLER